MTGYRMRILKKLLYCSRRYDFQEVDGQMDFIYKAQFSVPRQTISILAVQNFSKTICRELKVSEKIQLELELALEEAMTALFSHSADKSTNTQTQVGFEVFHTLIKISIKTPGRPFDFVNAGLNLTETPVGN